MKKNIFDHIQHSPRTNIFRKFKIEALPQTGMENLHKTETNNIHNEKYCAMLKLEQDNDIIAHHFYLILH